MSNGLTQKELNNTPATPASVQVTSAEILSDAHDIKQTNFKKPKQTIQDLDELRSFQLARRKEYEQQLNKNRLNYGQWIRYAKWELEHNHDFKRARSIMERALEVNVQHIPFWVRYIEFELLNKNVNHARNLLDRAVTIIPRADKLWFIYVQTEEVLGNYNGVRAVFERWLTWKPDILVWDSYLSFEERYGEYDNMRKIYARFITEFPRADIWERWISFEIEIPSSSDEHVARVRGIFEAAIDSLVASKPAQGDNKIPDIIDVWAKWEASKNEFSRAHAIYTTILDGSFLSKEQKLRVLDGMCDFEGIYDGESMSSGTALHLKRKLQYEKAVVSNPRDYDSWWSYIMLEETASGVQRAMELLEKALQTRPADSYKSTSWRRYIFLWIKLALYTEYISQDAQKARELWKHALEAVPHSKFTFGKLWIMFAEFEMRSTSSVELPRKILGRAIGQGCQNEAKKKIFAYYIEFETSLGNWDRVRKIYEKWLERSIVSTEKVLPGSTSAVLEEYIDLEKSLGEAERCIALYDIGVSQNFPGTSKLFENYVNYLKEEFRYAKAREVFKQRLLWSESANTWIQYALFESSILSPDQLDALEKAESGEIQFQINEHHFQQTRAIFNKAYEHFKSSKDAENALEITQSWIEYERMYGSEEQLKQTQKKAPKLTTKRIDVNGVTEVSQSLEFPEATPSVGKFLANAKKWAKTVDTQHTATSA